jgi:hypothetical protein
LKASGTGYLDSFSYCRPSYHQGFQVLLPKGDQYHLHRRDDSCGWRLSDSFQYGDLALPPRTRPTFPSRFGYDSAAEEADVATSFFTSDHQGNYDMEDYVYDSDYDHEAESESDVEYDSDDYATDDDSFTASTDDTEESSLLEAWHLDEPHQARHCMEEVYENGAYVSTYDLMSGAASILRCSPRLRGKPSPCYTKGKIGYSMRCN